jgi:hypothetical protein
MNLARNGNPSTYGEEMVVVRVADHVDHVLTGHPGRQYESPPQSREQGLALVQVLVGYTPATLNGRERWSCPIAGGRRTVWVTPIGTPSPTSRLSIGAAG